MKIQGVVREGSYKCPCCTGTFDLNLWNYHHRGDLSCILSDFVVGYETIETWLAENRQAQTESGFTRAYADAVEQD